jgi:hypothetical protein
MKTLQTTDGRTIIVHDDGTTTEFHNQQPTTGFSQLPLTPQEAFPPMDPGSLNAYSTWYQKQEYKMLFGDKPIDPSQTMVHELAEKFKTEAKRIQDEKRTLGLLDKWASGKRNKLVDELANKLSSLLDFTKQLKTI